MKQPLYALHRDKTDKVLAASSFTHSFQLNDWLRNIDVRAGDTVSFEEVVVRPEFDEVEPLAPPPADPTPAFAMAEKFDPAAGDDKPF